jgi:hypothetical protein
MHIELQVPLTGSVALRLFVPGDVVALCGYSSPDWITAEFAITRSGTEPVQINRDIVHASTSLAGDLINFRVVKSVLHLPRLGSACVPIKCLLQ